MSAMYFRLKNGGPPYADFAVFTPHGERHAQFHKFNAQILVDGAWASNRLTGPLTFEAWKESWGVFKSTMISLQCVAVAVIDAYEAGIAALVMMFPQEWGAIFAADQMMRGEVWKRTAERLSDRKLWPTHVKNHERWSHIFKVTSFGGDELANQFDHWWRMHVIYPCQSHKPTMPFIQAVEGTPLVPAPGGFVAQPHPHAGRSNDVQGRGRGNGGGQGRSNGGHKRRKTNQGGGQQQQQHWQPQQSWKKKPGKGQGKDEKPKGQGKDGKPQGGKGDGKPYIVK